MMRLDHRTSSADSTALHNIGINGSLCEKIHRTDLLRFLFEDLNEFRADELALLLRLRDAREQVVITFLCIDTNKIQIKIAFWSEDRFYFIALILAKKTMIHKYAGQLLPNCFRKKCCSDRRIYAAGQSKEDFSVSDLLPQLLNGRLRKRRHLPASGTTADIDHKVLQKLHSLFGMKNLRMELCRIKSAFRILHRCHRAVCRMCRNMKAFRNLCNIIRMTHPHGRGSLYILKQERGCIIHQHLRMPVLTDRCRCNLSSQTICHQL